MRGAAELACSRCYFFRGERRRGCSSSSPRLTCGLCRLPGNLSQQAGWAGFAKQRGSRQGWVWAAWYTVSSLITHICSLNSRRLGLWPLRAPAFPVSRVAWQRSGHVRPGAARLWRVLSWGASPQACQVPRPELLRGFSQGDVETSGLPPTCLSLLSAPPHLPTETPQGVLASGSLLDGAIPGWGGACFHSLGAACCSEVCLPLTSGPGRLLPLASPAQPLAQTTLLG